MIPPLRWVWLPRTLMGVISSCSNSSRLNPVRSAGLAAEGTGSSAMAALPARRHARPMPIARTEFRAPLGFKRAEISQSRTRASSGERSKKLSYASGAFDERFCKRARQILDVSNDCVATCPRSHIELDRWIENFGGQVVELENTHE